MYNELNEYINYYSDDSASTSCYWEELGYEYANNILTKFDDSDWNNLLDDLNNKSTVWKKRLVYAMHNSSSDMKLKVAQKLLNTDDIDLFELIIVRIMDCDLSKISNKSDFINKIKQFSSSQSLITQNIFLSFLKKLKEGEQKTK